MTSRGEFGGRKRGGVFGGAGGRVYIRGSRRGEQGAAARLPQRSPEDGVARSGGEERQNRHGGMGILSLGLLLREAYLAFEIGRAHV